MTFARTVRLAALLSIGFVLSTVSRPLVSLAADRPVAVDSVVYELRTYTAHAGKLPNVLARFRDHTTALFVKHGMSNVGYFVPLDSANGAGRTLVYVLRHNSRSAAAASWRAFVSDPAWKSVAAASERDGPIVAKIEAVFLAAADFSPQVFSTAARGASAGRVFELRRYSTPPNGLANLDARFRDHTLALFSKHGMTNVAYWHPTDSTSGAGSTLVYLLAHDSRERATASWASFRADSAWITARTASERQAGGSLTTSVTSVFLAPTDFSTLR